jgi:hypothetical protein
MLRHQIVDPGMQCKQSLVLRLLMSALLQLRIRVLLLKQRQVNAESSCSFIAFPVLVSRDREEMRVTGGVMIGQAQMAKILKFSRLINYIYVTFWPFSRLISNLIAKPLLLTYLERLKVKLLLQQPLSW